MDINDIIVDVPAWKWVLALIFTLGLTLVRYYGEKKWFLASVRLSILAILSFLLLEPLLKSVTSEVEPSTIVLAYDASQSQWMGKDSVDRKTALESWATQGQGLFEQRGYAVEVWDFAKQLNERETWKCDGNRTDLSSALEGIKNKYVHRNVRAVVVTSDGLSNRGRDPEYGTASLEVPHFFIGTGDTTQIKDVEISELYSNQVTYLNNEFPVEIRIKANGYEGERGRLKLYLGSDLVESIDFKIEGGFITHKFSIKATQIGMQRIKAAIIPQEGEERTENNYTSSYIEVLDSKRKITIIAQTPHPDITALKECFLTNLHQEVDVVFSYELSANTEVGECDVIVLHNIPNSHSTTPKAVTKAINSDIPILFIGGSYMDWSNIPLERVGVGVETSKSQQVIRGGVNEGFGLFDIPEGLKVELAYLPPLSKAMGETKPSASLNILIFQKLDQLKTEWPLLAFNKDAIGRRSGILMGEGIWRWRMEGYMKNGDTRVFDALLNNSIQYLDSRDDVRRFRVVSPKRLEEDERVKFTAQVYDAALNPTIDSDVSLSITNESGEELDYNFSVENNAFKLDCGRLSPGEYNWKAQTILDGILETLRGAFVVSEVKAELVSEAANHGLLKRLGLKSGGDLIGQISTVYTEDIGDEFAQLVDDRIEKRDIIHEFTERFELININFILWLVLGGLTLEWVIRRRQGSY